MRENPADPALIRRYDPATKVVTLARDLAEPTRAFQLATQLSDLLFGELFFVGLATAGLKSQTARDIARIGLGNYAAGALLMPYRHFAASAMSLRHDIEQLQRRYAASFEQVSHRLSTLQRPGARGVPFYFVRVDQAGNITKRHSSTRFQFARFGGACPLWNVHEAFGHPGRILVQVAEMPDGVRYLCIGRSIVKRSGNYLQPNRHYAIGIGCEIAHADKVVYSEGVRLDGPPCRWASAAGSASGPTATSARSRRSAGGSPCSRTSAGSCPTRSSKGDATFQGTCAFAARRPHRCRYSTIASADRLRRFAVVSM